MQDRKGADPGYLVPGTWYLAPVPNSHTSIFLYSQIKHPDCRDTHSSTLPVLPVWPTHSRPSPTKTRRMITLSTRESPIG
jgi:hypothetical protein